MNEREGGYPGFYNAVSDTVQFLVRDYGFVEVYREYCDLGPCVGFRSKAVWVEVCLDHRAGEMEVSFNEVDAASQTERPFRLKELAILQDDKAGDRSFIRFARDAESMRSGLKELSAELQSNGKQLLQGENTIFQMLRSNRELRRRR